MSEIREGEQEESRPLDIFGSAEPPDVPNGEAKGRMASMIAQIRRKQQEIVPSRERTAELQGEMEINFKPLVDVRVEPLGIRDRDSSPHILDVDINQPTDKTAPVSPPISKEEGTMRKLVDRTWLPLAGLLAFVALAYAIDQREATKIALAKQEAINNSSVALKYAGDKIAQHIAERERHFNDFGQKVEKRMETMATKDDLEKFQKEQAASLRKVAADKGAQAAERYMREHLEEEVRQYLARTAPNENSRQR